MARETVREGGQVALPREVLEQAGVNIGDVTEFEVLGPHRIEIRVIPCGDEPSPSQPSEPMVDAEGVAPPAMSQDPIDPDTLPILTLEEMLERYRIEGPIDFEAEREAWHDEAAKDVFGERPDRWPS
jgi:hypothetical protein